MREESFDAVFVGAGVIGLACAWCAAQRGLRVCVLDRAWPGGGATYAAAGLLAPVTEAEFGEEPLLRLNLASARAYPAFVAGLEQATGRDVGYARSGTLYVALDRDELEELERLHDLQVAYGLNTMRLGGRACRRLEPGLTPRCAGGLHAPSEAQVDPRRLAAALVDALERTDGEVRPGVEVAEVDADCVTAADGTRYHATKVVLAAGSWSCGLLDLPVHPVKGQIARLRAPVSALPALRTIRTRWVYIVPRPDGEVVVGATAEDHGYDETVTAGAVHELLREGYRALPELAELEFVEACARPRPGSVDNRPFLGATVDGLLVAAGHYRHGILLAPITAAAVAALLVGDRPPVDLEPFSLRRFAAAEA